MSGYDGIPACGCRNTTHDPTCSLGGSVTAVGHTTTICALCGAYNGHTTGCSALSPLLPIVILGESRIDMIFTLPEEERQAHRIALERAYRAGWERYREQVAGGPSHWGDAEEGAAAAWANGERP